MQTLKQRLSLAILVLVVLVLNLRFFPGQAMKTLVETLIHFFSVAPINLGASLVLVSLLQRLVGERLPWDRVVRIYLTVAILVECILGLSHYFEINGVL